MSGRSLDGLHLAPSAGPACEAVPRCLLGFDKPAASPHNISSPSDLLPLLWSFGLSLRPYLRSRFRRSCQSDSLVMPTDNVVAIYPTDSALNLQGNWTDFSLQNPQGNDQTVVFASSSASGSVKFNGKQPVQVLHSPFPVVSQLRLRCQARRSPSTAWCPLENRSSLSIPSMVHLRPITSRQETQPRLNGGPCSTFRRSSTRARTNSLST